MKKILLAKDLKSLFPVNDSFLDRSDVRVVAAGSTDAMLRICAAEAVDLIVIKLDMPGVRCEDLISAVRSDPKQKKASVIIICQDTLAHRERVKQCKANAVITMPIDEHLLQIKMQQFLNVAPRMVYRATLAVAIEGKFKTRPMPFWTENISESGMLIKTAEPLAEGAGVFISFFLPGGTHVAGYGEIVRAAPVPEERNMHLYGIKFTNVDEDAKSAIRSVVTRKRRSSAA